MEKVFKKHETLFTILLIIIYVVVNSYLMQNFGYTSLQSVIVNTILSILIITLIVALKRVNYYGINRASDPKRFLYFVPLIIISLFNLRRGIHINNTTNERKVIDYIAGMTDYYFTREYEDIKKLQKK